MKRIAAFLILITCLVPVPLSVYAAQKPRIIIDQWHTLSDQPPSAVDKELVPNIKDLIKKPLAKFGNNVQKRFSARVVENSNGKKLNYANAKFAIADIHAEYIHAGNVYTSTISGTISIIIPSGVTAFTKDFNAQGSLSLNAQWSEWIGVNKVTVFTLNKFFDRIVNDIEFAAAIKNIDPAALFRQQTGQEAISISPAQATPATSIEDRLNTLESLKDKGLITNEEYLQKKKKILDEL
jgi:hypothetical protein